MVIVHDLHASWIFDGLPETWCVVDAMSLNDTFYDGVPRRLLRLYHPDNGNKDNETISVTRCANGNWVLLSGDLSSYVTKNHNIKMLDRYVAKLTPGVILYGKGPNGKGKTLRCLGETISCLRLSSLCLDGIGEDIHRWMRLWEIESVVVGDRYHPISYKPFGSLRCQTGPIRLRLRDRGSSSPTCRKYRMRLCGAEERPDIIVHRAVLTISCYLSMGEIEDLRRMM